MSRKQRASRGPDRQKPDKREPGRQKPDIEGPDGKRAVRWTDRARRDLLEIGDYIARDNPAAAEQWTTALLQLASRAALLPLAGRRVPEFAREDVREVFLRTYRLVYRTRQNAIDVLTIFEGHRLLSVDTVTIDAFESGGGDPTGR